MVKQTNGLITLYVNQQAMKQVRKGVEGNGYRLLMGLHSGMDSGNGDETIVSSNISLTRIRRNMWWQVWFHF